MNQPDDVPPVEEQAPLDVFEGVQLSDWSDFDVDAGLARFEQSLAATATGGGVKVGAWLAALATGGAVVAAVALGGEAGDATPAHADVGSRGPDPVAVQEALPPPPDPRAAPEPQPAPPSPGLDELGEPAEAASPEPKAVHEPSRRTAHRRVTRRGSPEARPTEPSGPSELELAATMRRALSTDPARALALAKEGEERFPGGMFRRERQAHEIFALVALGKADAARRRAKLFLRRYPKGPQSDRVRDAITRPASEK